jgi:predicted methyltransferase
VGEDFPDSKSALEAIVKSPHRVPEHAARDKYRHPVETLTFFGIEPNMTVLEAGAGTGWYSDILGPLVAKKGKLIIATLDPDAPLESFAPIIGLRVKLFMARAPEIFGNAKMTIIDPPKKLKLGEPGSVDMVLVFREMHNWVRWEYFPEYVKAIHEVLKPGGVLGVVQHRAKPDAKVEDSANNGYVPEEWLIKQLEAAGFKLEARSEVNANPKDTKDYEEGVWTLPPGYRLGETDRAKYEAIGESDRMTLKFVKPAK